MCPDCYYITNPRGAQCEVVARKQRTHANGIDRPCSCPQGISECTGGCQERAPMTTTTVHAVSTTGINTGKNMLEKAAHAKFYRAAAPTVHFLQNRFHIALSHLATAGVSFQVRL